MASILPTPSDCCDQCCEVNIVDLPSGGGSTSACCNKYDSIVALRNEGQTSVLVDDTMATLYGSVTRGDGLGGLYFFDAAAVDADDGVSVIQPNSIIGAAPGRWKKWIG